MARITNIKSTESTTPAGALGPPSAAPEPSSSADAIRALSQPKRQLYHYLTSKFASGALKAGGRVILRSGPNKAPTAPSVSALMKGRL